CAGELDYLPSRPNLSADIERGQLSGIVIGQGPYHNQGEANAAGKARAATQVKPVVLGDGVQTESRPWDVLAEAFLVAENHDGPFAGLFDFEGQAIRIGSCPGEEEQLLLLEVDLPGDPIAPVRVRVREGLRQLLGARDFGGFGGHPAGPVASEPFEVDRPDER